MARLPESILGAGTTAFRLGNSTKQGFDTLASFVSTIACAPHVCVNTHTSIQTHGQSRKAFTSVGTISVDTTPIHADSRCFTLINIFTITPI